MYNTKMRIQKFVVRRLKGTPPLEDLLAQIDADTRAQRNRVIHGVRYRLDDVDHDADSNLWYLNFIRTRTGHGPGKFSAGSVMSGFPYGNGELPGEDAAAVFDPANRTMHIQYNHIGVRHTAMQSYLSEYTGQPRIYEIRPKLELNMERKFQQQDVIRRLELGFDITKMTAEDRNSGRSLQRVSRIGNEMDADKLYITLTISSRDTRKRLSIEKIKEQVHALLPLADREALIKAKAYGGSEPVVTEMVAEKPGKTRQKAQRPDFEVIDLLDQVVETEVPMKLGSDYRMPLQRRYAALKYAHSKI